MNILIAGGSGLVGTRLSALLTEAGHSVAHLSRRAAGAGVPYRVFQWDVNKGSIDPEAVPWADALVNLAGAGIADGRWTAKRKRELIDSRVKSAHLLREALRRGNHHVSVYVSASGTGAYGNSGDRVVDETTPIATGTGDFMAEIVAQWEAAAQEIRALGIRTAIMRLGVVLADSGGALPIMARPVKLGVGAALGSGRQWLSWIHLDDAAAAFRQAILDARFADVYDVTTAEPVTNADFNRTLARVLHRPLWLPNVPAFALRRALGEMSATVLNSNRVTGDRLRGLGFRPQFPTLEGALQDLLT